LAFPRRFALAFGRFLAAFFFFALGRDAFLFFFAGGRGLGAASAPPSASGASMAPADTSAPSCRGRSSCSPKNRLGRASD